MALKGKDWYLARVKAFITKFPGVVGDAMYQEATTNNGIAMESQKQCPVEHGTLKRSFLIWQAGTPDKPVVKISYGTSYAVYVHERVDLRHPVGKAKFLEDPIIAARPTWLQNVWRRANKAALGAK